MVFLSRGITTPTPCKKKKKERKKHVWFVFVTSLLNFWSSLCYLFIIYPLLYHLYRHLLSLLLFDTLIIFLIIYLHYYISSLSLLINFIAILYVYHPDHPSLSFSSHSFLCLFTHSFIHSRWYFHSQIFFIYSEIYQ